MPSRIGGAVRSFFKKDMATFKVEVKEFGVLAIEKVVVMRERPLVFLCANGKNHFLFYELTAEESFMQWLVVPVKTAVAKEILQGRIPVQVPFRKRECRCSDDTFVITKVARNKMGTLKTASLWDLSHLPNYEVYRTV